LIPGKLLAKIKLLSVIRFPTSINRPIHCLCLKSAGHFRSDLDPMAESIFNLETATLLTQEFSRLPLRRRGRRIHPVDRDAALLTIFTEGSRDAK
jgi:hypothetical protein